MKYSQEVRNMIREAYGTRSKMFQMLSMGNVKLSYIVRSQIKDPKKVHGEERKQNEFRIALYRKLKEDEKRADKIKELRSNGGREA